MWEAFCRVRQFMNGQISNALCNLQLASGNRVIEKSKPHGHACTFLWTVPDRFLIVKSFVSLLLLR